MRINNDIQFYGKCAEYLFLSREEAKYNLLASLRFEHPDELLPEACVTPDFPVLLPTAAADPADAAAVPDTPGGSANELVLGRPLPLISLYRGQG